MRNHHAKKNEQLMDTIRWGGEGKIIKWPCLFQLFLLFWHAVIHKHVNNHLFLNETP